jgi:hypothetical protein
MVPIIPPHPPTWPAASRQSLDVRPTTIRVPVDAIALLARHNQNAITELVYRHQVVPALTRGRSHGRDLRVALRLGARLQVRP